METRIWNGLWRLSPTTVGELDDDGLEEDAEESIDDDGNEGRHLEHKADGEGRGGEHALKRRKQGLGSLIDPLDKRRVSGGTK